MVVQRPCGPWPGGADRTGPSRSGAILVLVQVSSMRRGGLIDPILVGLPLLAPPRDVGTIALAAISVFFCN